MNKQLYDIKYRELHEEHRRKLAKNYYQKFQDYLIDKSKIYYQENKEHVKQRVRKTNKIWSKNNPEKRLEINIRYLRRLGKPFNLTSYGYQYSLIHWSAAIKKLDNYMCKLCDSRENLNAHHIMPKSEYPELSLDLDNGITLCVKCHETTHGFNIGDKH